MHAQQRSSESKHRVDHGRLTLAHKYVGTTDFQVVSGLFRRRIVQFIEGSTLKSGVSDENGVN